MSVMLDTELDSVSILAIVRSAMDPAGFTDRVVVSVDDVPLLVARILTSRRVEIAYASGLSGVVRPRDIYEAANSWLGRVVEALMQHTPAGWARVNLVVAVIEQFADTALVLTRRSRGVHEASDEHLVHPVAADHNAIWAVLGLPVGADVGPLLELLAGALADLSPQQPTSAATPDVFEELERTVTSGDAKGFAAKMSVAAGGEVLLRWADGDIAAEAVWTGGGTISQDIVVTEGEAIIGSIEVRGARRRLDSPDRIGCLAGAVFRIVRAERARAALENEVAVLACVGNSLLLTQSTADDYERRLVLIRSAQAGTRWSMTGLIGRIQTVASRIAELESLAVACRGSDEIVGVYVDDGAEAHHHRAAWVKLLDDVDKAGHLYVSVSPPIQSRAEVGQGLNALERLGSWQRTQSTRTGAVIADELGPVWSSIGTWPKEGVDPYVRRVLGTLLDDTRFGGELTDTLYAYLQTDRSLRAAAERLHLHSSTVKYRIRVARDLLGDRLNDPDERFELELALRMHLTQRSLGNEVTP